MTPSTQGPQPVPTTETAPYWQAALEGRLKIQFCRSCNRHQFYPRRFCTECLSDGIEWVQASGRGHIYTYTVCHVAAHPAFEPRVPYAIGMVALEEGVRMLAGIVAPIPDRLAIGEPVEVCFEPIGDAVALPMFRLADGESTASPKQR
ncbi:Zn-ribbon domain-containing OB-fold protein [Variovorax sp. J22P168]|uniref:Zn-ribbon domain-containing OB-fold protein n=1 Tax=Variovorax jilinensis TaxID=3053513 RepID=UPI0025772554|nr:Zn-ribbon domain-containing OB-fold protein [Variovorax sp. J22P168]MDM0015801.1 Zn-ribbon domain-containing OB-fold protein [Variovorax sp. J22P168]